MQQLGSFLDLEAKSELKTSARSYQTKIVLFTPAYIKVKSVCYSKRRTDGISLLNRRNTEARGPQIQRDTPGVSDVKPENQAVSFGFKLKEFEFPQNVSFFF